jgi:predicted phage tail protein
MSYVTVRLHGSLRELELLYGNAPAQEGFIVWAGSTVAACRLLAAQIPAFDQAMRGGYFRVRLGPMGKGGKTMRAGRERFPLGDVTEIHITPAGVAAGGKKGAIGKVAMGIVLIGLAIVTGGAAAGPGVGLAAAMAAPAVGGITFGQIAFFGASLALTGAATLLTSDPQIARYENREASEDRPNFLFNGAVNTVGEGPAIAWVYGTDVFVGTNVISASIRAEQLLPPRPPSTVYGIIGQVGASADGIVAAKR